jgi:hypothetical protein
MCARKHLHIDRTPLITPVAICSRGVCADCEVGGRVLGAGGQDGGVTAVVFVRRKRACDEERGGMRERGGLRRQEGIRKLHRGPIQTPPLLRPRDFYVPISLDSFKLQSRARWKCMPACHRWVAPSCVCDPNVCCEIRATLHFAAPPGVLTTSPGRRRSLEEFGLFPAGPDQGSDMRESRRLPQNMTQLVKLGIFYFVCWRSNYCGKIARPLPQALITCFRERM